MRARENAMNKLKVFLAALALVCGTGVAYAQPIPPEQLAAFRRLLVLVVWVPLTLTILCEIFLKYRLLLRFGAQTTPRALKFSAARPRWRSSRSPLAPCWCCTAPPCWCAACWRAI